MKPRPSHTPFNPSADPSATPSSDLEFIYNGEIRYIADNYEEKDVVLPEGFEKRLFKYKDSNISGAQNSSGVKLIYATDVLGENGSFYIFINSATPLMPYLEIPYNGNNYVFITFDEKPENLTETTLLLGENTVIAYTISNEEYKDFLVLYGFKAGGELFYYLYDNTEGTLQRCIDPSTLEKSANGGLPTESPVPGSTGAPTSSPSPVRVYPENEFQLNKKDLLFIIIAVCITAIIIAVIVIIVRSRRIAKSFENEEDFFDDSSAYAIAAAKAAAEAEETEASEETVETEKPEEYSVEDSAKETFNFDDDDDDEILQLRND